MKRVRGAVSSGINYVEEDRLQAEKRLEEKRVAKRIEAEKKSEERRAEAAKKLEAKRVAAEKKLEEKKIAAEKKSKEEEGRHADQQRELKDIYDFFRKRGSGYRHEGQFIKSDDSSNKVSNFIGFVAKTKYIKATKTTKAVEPTGEYFLLHKGQPDPIIVTEHSRINSYLERSRGVKLVKMRKEEGEFEAFKGRLTEISSDSKESPLKKAESALVEFGKYLGDLGRVIEEELGTRVSGFFSNFIENDLSEVIEGLDVSEVKDYADFQKEIKEFRGQLVNFAINSTKGMGSVADIAAKALASLTNKMTEVSWHKSNSLDQSHKDFIREDGLEISTKDTKFVKGDGVDSLGLRILHSLDALCSEEEILLIKERVNRNLKVNLNEPSSVIANGQLGEGGTADIFECINGVIGEKHPFMRHYLAVNQAVAEGTGVDLTGHLQDVLGTEDFLIMQGNSRKVEAKIIDSDSGLKAVYRMESIIKIADGITLDLKDQIPFVSYMTLDLSDQNAVPEVVFDLEYSDGKKEYKSTNMMNEEVTINGFSKDSDDRIKITGYVESMNGAYEERLNEVKAEFDSVEPGVEYKPAVEGDLSFAPAGAARNDSGLGETSTDNDPNLPPAGNNERPSPVVSSPRNEGVALNGVSSNGAIAVK